MAARLWRTGALLILTVAAVVPARAQGVEGQVGRFYEDGGWDMYRLGMSRALTGISSPFSPSG